jgi:hypothetical protein
MATQAVEVKFPDEIPTDKQLYVIARILRENPPKARPKFPITRLEASQLIGKLKR